MLLSHINLQECSFMHQVNAYEVNKLLMLMNITMFNVIQLMQFQQIIML